MLLKHRPILGAAPKEFIPDLMAREELNDAEQAYLDDVKLRKEAAVDKKDYAGRVRFFRQELRNFRGSDLAGNGRVALERKLRYALGHSHEALATFGMDEADDPVARAREFQIAAQWYQRADETVGSVSDYAMRQAESCFGAAHYLHQAGMTEESQEIRARGEELLRTFLDGTGIISFGIIGGEQAEKMLAVAAEHGRTTRSSGGKMHITGTKPSEMNPGEN